MKLSVIIPIHNEEENIGSLYQELSVVLDAEPWDSEIVVVDDGSSDQSAEFVRGIAKTDPRIRFVELARNFGEAAAIRAGIDASSGDILVTMDADLQNDPADIPKLVAKIEEGYDVVTGWRKERKDRWLTRGPSLLTNVAVRWLSRVPLRDFGCPLRAYRASALRDMELTDELHRFVSVHAFARGLRVTEVQVQHRERMFGASPLRLGRGFKTLLDLSALLFVNPHRTKPVYVLGGLGALLIALGIGGSALAIGEKVFADAWSHNTLALGASLFLLTNGVVLAMSGLVSELVVRIYRDQRGQAFYRAKDDAVTALAVAQTAMASDSNLAAETKDVSNEPSGTEVTLAMEAQSASTEPTSAEVTSAMEAQSASTEPQSADVASVIEAQDTADDNKVQLDAAAPTSDKAAKPNRSTALGLGVADAAELGDLAAATFAEDETDTQSTSTHA